MSTYPRESFQCETLPLSGEVNAPYNFLPSSTSKDAAQPKNANQKNSVTSRQMQFPFKNQSARKT